MQKPENVFSWIVKIGLWLIPFLPLYVSSSMLFPFITGKNFTFRIIVEIIFALWVGLAVLKSEYRPRLTPIFKIVTIFTTIVFLADLTSPNPYRSFFSNYERMEGFMMIGHLYLYFVMLSAMFRTRRDWLIFLHSSLAASVLASYYGLLQRLGYRVSLQGGFRVDSTIGNPTYFAAYLLFHVWLLSILMYQFWKRWWQAALYAVLLVFELAMVYFTATRGVVLALAAALIPLAAAALIWWNRIREVREAGGPGRAWNKGRLIAGTVLAIVVLIPIVFWSVRGTAFVQESQALRRLTNYSLREGTIKDRFFVWGMSLRAVRERPILGWGQENYYLVFQKYYDPRLWGAEPWFDRSHNVFLDWAVHTGLLGLGAYLGIFGMVLFAIVRAMRRPAHHEGAVEFRTAAGEEEWRRGIFFEGLLLMGLFTSYFLQNLFVFDNLNSYLLFFAFLAYADHRMRGGEAGPEHEKNEKKKSVAFMPRAGAGAAGGVSALVLAAVLVWGYMTIIRPLQESRSLIRTLQMMQRRATIPEVQASFRETLRRRTFGDTEVREQIAHAAFAIVNNETLTPGERRAFVEFARGELEKETAHAAKDVKHVLFLAGLLNRALVLDTGYASETEAAAREAVRLSPGKHPAYFELAQFYLAANRLPEALETLQRAWRLEPRFPQAAINLWIVSALAGKQEVIAEIERVFSLEELGPPHVLSIARAYVEKRDYDRALKTYAVLVRVDPANAQNHADYAALLERAGRMTEARHEAGEAIRLNPDLGKPGR